MSEFKALLDELEVLSKAMPSGDDGDQKIKDAAGDGDGDQKIKDAAGDGDGADGQGGAGDGDGDSDKGQGGDQDGDDTFGKSFQVQLEDGSTVEAFDGTEMMKSLFGQVEELKTANAALSADRDASLAVAKQSMELIKSLQGTVTQLQADVSRLANAPAGRKAVVNVLDKPTGGAPLAKSEGLAPLELKNKALEAQRAGRIGASEVARVDAYLGKALPLPADLLHAIGA